MSNPIKVTLSEGDEAVGYVYLPVKSEKKITQTIGLHELIKGYKGIPIYLDFNKKMELVGIEMVGD